MGAYIWIGRSLPSSQVIAMMLMLFVLLVASFVSVVDSQCSGSSEGRGDASCVCDNTTFSCVNAGLSQLPEDIPVSVTLM